MNKDSLSYKIISTKECMEYIESHGVDINKWSKYKIKSKSGLVYEIQNGEFVLIPSTFDKTYPGIIFADKQTFLYYFNLDSFPIEEAAMTWFEKYRTQIQVFIRDDEFYTKSIRSKFEVECHFLQISDIENAFMKIRSISNLKDYKSSPEKMEEILNSFGLSVIKYLVDVRKYDFEILDRYAIYNPAPYPIAIFNGKRIDVISKAIRGIYNTNEDAFQIFLNQIGLKQN